MALQIVLWSLIVSFFNFSAIIIVGPFLKVFSQETKQQAINLSSLVPEKLLALLPVSKSFSIDMGTIIWTLPLFIALVAFLSALAQYYLKYLQQVLSIKAADTLRLNLFSKIMGQSFYDLKKRTSSEWVSLVLNDVYFYQKQFTEICTGFFKNSAVILGIIPAMFFVNSKLFLVYVLMLPILILLFRFFGESLSKRGDAYQGLLRSVLNAVFDIRKRYDFIKAESTEPQANMHYGIQDRSFYKKVKGVLYIRNFVSPFVEFFGYAVFALMVYGFVNAKFSDMITPVEAIQFVVAVGISVKPLREAGTLYIKLQEALGVLSIVSSYLVSGEHGPRRSIQGEPTFETKPLNQARHPQKVVKSIDDLQIARIRYQINSDIDVDVGELNIVQGDFIAIIGASGSGKSTFLRLMAGLFEPDEWQANVSRDVLKANSILLTQEPFVFSDTVGSNVSYASPLYDRQLSTEAKQLSRYESMVAGRKMTDESRLDFLRSEISGGQKQSLALARVFYQNKDLCLLDEPTSAYDLSNEAALYINLKKHLSRRSVLMITHRLNNLDLFSAVWLFDQGKIICKGKHKDLLESSPVYRKFCGVHANQ